MRARPVRGPGRPPAAVRLVRAAGLTAYATDPLQARRGALGAALVLGLVWALIHVIPYAQAGHGARCILGQCLCTVALRVVLSWIYANAGPGILGRGSR